MYRTKKKDNGIDLRSKEIDIEKVKYNNTTLKRTLALQERKALYESSKRNDIIQSNADKNDTVVNQDVGYYITDTEQQFDNKGYYKILNCAPTETNKKLIDQTIN